MDAVTECKKISHLLPFLYLVGGVQETNTYNNLFKRHTAKSATVT